METINLRVANLQHTTTEESTYSVSVKVPLKEELLRLLTKHLDHIKTPLAFTTGILTSLEFSIDLCIFREYNEPKIGVFVKLSENPARKTIVELTRIDIDYVSELRENVDDCLTNCAPPKGLEIDGYEFWEAKFGWPDNTSIVFLLFHVLKRYRSHFINEEVDLLTPLPLPLNNSSQICVDDYFLSSEFSDVNFTCGNMKFPAHRLVLAKRSKYFAAMFASSMKESNEGLVKMEDMDPGTFKEFLRFIYQNKIDHFEECVKELFIAADKYGMEDLRAVCERQMLQNLSVDNAMEVYDLCQMHGQGVLLQKAKQILVGNKNKFAADPQCFKEFVCKYPELMFELFTST